MIYEKDSNGTTIETVVTSEQKKYDIGKYLMKSTIIVAGMVASKMIMQNVAVFMQQGSSYVHDRMLLLGIIMLGCSIRCIVDEFILSPYADKKRQDTIECAKKVHTLSNSELVKLFLIERCPEVAGVQLQDKGGIFLKGRYTTHFVEFGQNGATIISKKKDYRADIEANAIMRVLVRACN